MASSQIKKALYAFLLARCLFDVTLFSLGLWSFLDDSEEVGEKESEEDLVAAILHYLSGTLDRAIVMCVMFMFSRSWNFTPVQMLLVMIGLFYDTIIGIAVWGIVFDEIDSRGSRTV